MSNQVEITGTLIHNASWDALDTSKIEPVRRASVPVYGVWTHDWEDSRLHALYTSREQAEEHCEAFNADPMIEKARKTDLAGYERWHARVEEHMVFDAFDGLVVSAS